VRAQSTVEGNQEERWQRMHAGCMETKRSLVRSPSSPTVWVAAMCSLFASAAGAEEALVNLGTLNGGTYSSASRVSANG
jgi:hypothetical protein